MNQLVDEIHDILNSVSPDNNLGILVDQEYEKLLGEFKKKLEKGYDSYKYFPEPSLGLSSRYESTLLQILVQKAINDGFCASTFTVYDDYTGTDYGGIVIARDEKVLQREIKPCPWFKNMGLWFGIFVLLACGLAAWITAL